MVCPIVARILPPLPKISDNKRANRNCQGLSLSIDFRTSKYSNISLPINSRVYILRDISHTTLVGASDF